MFPEFASIITGIAAGEKFQDLTKNCTLTHFVCFGTRSQRNAPKNGEPTVGFSFATMLQHTG
jgi:hypothetical protein